LSPETIPCPEPSPELPSPESSPEPVPSPESSPEPVPSPESSPEPVPSPDSYDCTMTCYDLWYFVCYNPHNQTIFDNEVFASNWEQSTRPWIYTTPTTPCFDPWFNQTNINEMPTDWCEVARRTPNPFYDTEAFAIYISTCYNTPIKPEIPCVADQPEPYTNVIVNSQ
jgi:hypothetical protein